MNPSHPDSAERFTFADGERMQLLTWARLSASVKIEFFEEMIQLAYHSGALAPDRLALRDKLRVNLAQGGDAPTLAGLDGVEVAELRRG